jgi:hypothetical protein
MKLDQRIKSLSDILTCVDVEEAKLYIGQKGYFADHLDAFEDLNGINKCRDFDVLVRFDEWELPFVAGNIHWRYFLPEDRLKPAEKKYRPFTVEEFTRRIGDVGGCVRYRFKDDSEVFRSVITEIRETSGFVMLGNSLISVERLLSDFEYYDNGTWKPFGMEE